MYALTVLNGTAINVTIEDTGPDWVAIAIAVATGVLAVITYFYMRETKLLRLEAEKTRLETEKMRKETTAMRVAAQRPSFVIEPSQYVLGGDFIFFDLVNRGQQASDIDAVCMWGEKLEEQGGSARQYYIISLAKDGRSPLHDLPVQELVKSGHVLVVEIKCKDSQGDAFDQKIRIDFAKTKNSSIRIAYQHDDQRDMITELDRMVSALRGIEGKIDKLANKK